MWAWPIRAPGRPQYRTIMGMVTDLEQRVLNAVNEQNDPPESPPPHGLLGAVRWRVDSDGPGGAPRSEGGYVCHCGSVFARPAAEGGIQSSLMAFMAHEGSP